MLKNLSQLYHRITARHRAYLPIIPLCMLLAACYGVYHEQQKPQLHVSRGRIVVSGRMNLPEGNAYTEELNNFLGTQLEILGSDELAARARQQMLVEHPELNGTATVRTTLLRGTSIIMAEASGTNPEYTTGYLNALLQQFIESRRDRRIETTMTAMKQLREEIPAVERQLAAQEQELFRFKEQHNMAYLGRESADSGQLLAQLKAREAGLRMQLRLAEGMQAGAVTADRETRVSAIGELGNAIKAQPKPGESRLDEQIAPLRQQLIKLQVEREQLLGNFKPKHPRIVRLDQEIQKQNRLVELLSRESEKAYTDNIEGMRIELQSVSQSITEWESKAMESSRNEAEYEKLQASLTRTRELYSRLVNGLQSIDVSKGVSVDIVQILQSASPAQPVTVALTSVLKTSLGHGLIIGFILSFVAARLDQRAFSAAEIAEAIQEPVMVEIPFAKELNDKRRQAGVLADLPAPLMEAMRRVTAALNITAKAKAEPKVVLCVSTTPGEGKSTLSLHLAAHAARAGLKTLLIDADLRRGRLGEKIGLSPDHAGMAELIERHNADWSTVVHPVAELGNLCILPRGNPGPRTLDLLPNLLTDEIFTTLKTHFQLIVIDSAPLLPVADSMRFLSCVDHVLMVTRIKSTSLPLAGKIASLLHRQKDLPVHLIVNGISENAGQYDYYY